MSFAIPSRLVPRSLAGRTVLTLLVGLTASHLLSMVVYSSERVESLVLADETQSIERIATIAALIDEVPVQWRQAIVEAANSPILHVSVAARGDPPGALGGGDPALAALLHQRLRAGPERRIQASLAEPAGVEGDVAAIRWAQEAVVGVLYGPLHGRVVRASIEAADGQWINFHSPVPDFHPTWAGHAGISALVMGSAILLLSFWVVRRLTRPLSQVAAAAERLGHDVEAPPLPETGPDEVRMVAHAFNSMQERLRRFVEDRTRMLAAISHDLRTPITLLRLRTEFISETEEKIRMRATLDEMEAMISATLSFARDDAANEPRQTVDLVGLLSSICYDLADAGLPVSFDPEPINRLPIDCRSTALKRALTNLIDNAVKYGNGAEVALSVSGANIVITVDDTGRGIPEAEQERVFAPFYRLDPSRNTHTGGVGLGLSVARTVIHAHGGNIQFENRPEGGLRVDVTIPLPTR
jgi:signal transduction histidine kinase